MRSGGGWATPQFDYTAAASYFAEAARIVGATDADARRGYLQLEAGALYDQGLGFGDLEALERS